MKKIFISLAIFILIISTGCGETQSIENNLNPISQEA